MISRARLKFLRSLRQKKVRAEEGLLLVEGIHAVEAAVEGGFARELLLGEEIAATARAREICARGGAGLVVQRLEQHDIDALGETENPAGAFALVESPVRAFEAAEFPGEALMLAIAGIADPGNLGTCIRAAAALGADGVVVAAGSVEPTNPKVVRASAGALFRIPVRTAEVAALHAAGMAVWVAEADGTPLDAYPARPPRLAIVVGSEPHGVEPQVRDAADAEISIPVQAGVESLNVSVAASILMFVARRLPVAGASVAPSPR